MIILILNENEEMYLKKLLSMFSEEPLSMQTYAEPQNALSFSDLMILPDQQRVLLKNKEIVLTYTEFHVLLHMAKRPGQVFSHSQLYHAVYENIGNMEGVENIIYCLIRRLRKKVEIDARHPRYIHTVRGVGYRFEVLPEE